MIRHSKNNRLIKQLNIDSCTFYFSLFSWPHTKRSEQFPRMKDGSPYQNANKWLFYCKFLCFSLMVKEIGNIITLHTSFCVYNSVTANTWKKDTKHQIPETLNPRRKGFYMFSCSLCHCQQKGMSLYNFHDDHREF